MMKTKTLRLSVLIISSLIFGFILLLNFGFGSLIENAEAQNNDQVNQEANLTATDTFNPDEIPYFQSQIVPAQTNNLLPTTITITNQWEDDIWAIIRRVSDRTVLQFTYIDSGYDVLSIAPTEPVELFVYALDPDGFRDWHNIALTSPFIDADGESEVAFESFAHVPDIRYFTTEATGTLAEDNFFYFFFSETSATSLPAGSFNISTIIEVGDNFFNGFNSSGSLQSLPDGSFDTSNIVSAGDSFFENFNTIGALTALPAGSFNFEALESHDNEAFQNFNNGGSLTSLPYNSFNLGSVTITGGDANSWQGFNEFGLLQYDSTESGLTIRNTSGSTQTFKYASGTTTNAGEIVVDSGSIFNGYKQDPAPSPSPTPTPTPTHTFTDISKLSAARQAAINWLYDQGITAGCNTENTKYCPEDPVNRGSMAVFLQLLSGSPSGSSNTSQFADVFGLGAKTITYISGSKTHKEKVSGLSAKRINAINWLAQSGITGGSGSAKVSGKTVQTFRAQDVVNRGSMASFMLKFSGAKVSTITKDSQTGFADIKIGSGNFTITYSGAKKGTKVAKVSAARATAIKWMKTSQITGGSGTDKSGNETYRAQDVVNRGSMASFMKKLYEYIN